MASGDKIILKDGKGLSDVSDNPNYKHQVVVDDNGEVNKKLIDSTVTNFIVPTVSAEIWMSEHPDLEVKDIPDNPGRYDFYPNNDQNAKYYNDKVNIIGLKLGLRFRNLPQIDGENIKTIHLELGRYKKSKRKTRKEIYVPSQTEGPGFTMEELEAANKERLYKQRRAGFKWPNDFRDEHEIYGYDFEDVDNIVQVALGNAKDIRPRRFEITEVNNHPYFFNFGSEYYFYPYWEAQIKTLLLNNPNLEIIDTSGQRRPVDYYNTEREYQLWGFPQSKGDGMHITKSLDKRGGLTTYRKYETLYGNLDETESGVPDVQFYNGLLQGKRRRTRILFAVRIKFNMGQPDEYVTPILTKFNLIGALYNGVDEYEQQGIIKITPSHI